MSDSVRLYVYWGSPHAQLSMFVLGLKQLPLSDIVIPLNPGTKSAEIIDNNPFKKIPVLVDGNYSLYESRAICRYLDKRFPNQGLSLIPTDIHEYGKMEQWISVEGHSWTPDIQKLVGQRVWGPLFRAATPDEKECQELVKKLIPIMEILNTQLGQTNYLVNNEITLADIVFTPNMQHLSTMPEKSQLLDPYPNIVRWWSAISATPAWTAIVKKANEVFATIKARQQQSNTTEKK